jgi:ComF family protein
MHACARNSSEPTVDRKDMLSLSAWARFAVEAVVSVLSPPACASCDTRVPMMHAFCKECADSCVRPSAHVSTYAAFAYGGAIARAIVRYKFESRPDLSRPLGDLLVRALPVDLEANLVVPVPLHPTRLAERGYNQAALLATRLAQHLSVPLSALALARTRNTPKQTSLERTARLANVADAIRARPNSRLSGARVLLVDDVRTTGATLSVCSRALLAAGARDVVTAVVAVAET